MPLEIGTVGQYAHWIIHEPQSVPGPLYSHAGPVLVRKDPVAGRHRIGNAVLLSHNTYGVKQGGCLAYGCTESQQEADKFNGRNGRPWVLKAVPESTVSYCA